MLFAANFDCFIRVQWYVSGKLLRHICRTFECDSYLYIYEVWCLVLKRTHDTWEFEILEYSESDYWFKERY